MGVPLTATLAPDQRSAQRQAKATQDHENQKGIMLEVSDDGVAPQYVIYVYNILNMPHERHMPPNFAHFMIPACPEGQKVSYTVLPPFVRNKFNKPGSMEYYYRREDGRKSAGQLLNPGSFPSIDWERQRFQNATDIDDQVGNNLNNFGVWWSLTKPDDLALDREIVIFEKRAREQMNQLVALAEQLVASGKLDRISPRMHFAMDYLKLKAPWHMSHQHMIACPTCGESIVAGVAYHRNSFGDKCIVDQARCEALGVIVPREVREIVEPAPPEPGLDEPGLEGDEETTPEMDEAEILRLAKNIITSRKAKMKEKQRKARIAAAVARATAHLDKPPDAT
jgi:hypothetical protein